MNESTIKVSVICPVVKTVDAVIDEIEKAIARGYTMDEEYQKRTEEFFFWPEPGVTHCELVLREILALNEKS